MSFYIIIYKDLPQKYMVEPTPLKNTVKARPLHKYMVKPGPLRKYMMKPGPLRKYMMKPGHKNTW